MADPRRRLGRSHFSYCRPELIIGLIDAIVALAATLVGAGLVTREQLAAAYQTAEAQQAAQPVDGAARRLAVHTMAQFFAAPVRTGKPALWLVDDNGPAPS